jgi:hypothetical protein
MDIREQCLYQADCLVFLERLEDSRAMLVYLDPPLAPPDEGSQGHLMFMSRVIQQATRVLDPRGSLFAHVEPRLAGEIRLLLNGVFGRSNYREEYVWLRSGSGHTATHEVIVRYSKTERFVRNEILVPLSEDDIRSVYREGDERRLYRLTDMMIPFPLPSQQFTWRGYTPAPGRGWRYSMEGLDEMAKEGRIQLSRSGGAPRLKRYLDESAGVPIGSVWSDLSNLEDIDIRTYKYPGQEPVAVLERIIKLGSNPGDLILDPFCGAGTTLVASQTLGRRWIGCDVDASAVEKTVLRLKQSHGLSEEIDYSVVHEDSLKTGLQPINKFY